MKFLVPNYSCLQNPWLGGYRPHIPVLSVPCPQLNLLNPPRTKFLGTPLHITATACAASKLTSRILGSHQQHLSTWQKDNFYSGRVGERMRRTVFDMTCHIPLIRATLISWLSCYACLYIFGFLSWYFSVIERSESPQTRVLRQWEWASLGNGETRLSPVISKSHYVLNVWLAGRCETELEWRRLSVMRSDVVIDSYKVQMSVQTPTWNFTKRCQYLEESHVDLLAAFTLQGCEYGVLCDEGAFFTFPASHNYTVHALM